MTLKSAFEFQILCAAPVANSTELLFFIIINSDASILAAAGRSLCVPDQVLPMYVLASVNQIRLLCFDFFSFLSLSLNLFTFSLCVTFTPIARSAYLFFQLCICWLLFFLVRPDGRRRRKIKIFVEWGCCRGEGEGRWKQEISKLTITISIIWISYDFLMHGQPAHGCTSFFIVRTKLDLQNIMSFERI